MFQFKRGISPDFVGRLNDEYKRGGWWKAIADDPSLFIAIRDEYLNVYWKGNSLLRLWMQGNALAGAVHYKYLLRPEAKTTPYLQIEDGRFRLENPTDFFLDDVTDIADLRRAADVFAGEEKTGVHQIVMSNPNIIDVEVAFGAEDEQSGAQVAQRIDFAALRHGKVGAELAFFEAKTFANPEIRASGRAVPVFGQLKRYRQFLDGAQADLTSSYRKVCGNLLSLYGVSKKFSALHSVFRDISEGASDLRISNDVRLVVFGYDRDPARGAIWAKHREKLQATLGHNLLLKGDPRNFTRGISSPSR